jgi:hypothetical protein
MSSQTIVFTSFYNPKDDGTAIAFSKVLARFGRRLTPQFLGVIK